MDTIWKVNQERFIELVKTQAKYKALSILIDEAITDGDLAFKQKLPAQRWLADELNVTHGTVTRAYELAQKKGLVKAKLGAGTFVDVDNTTYVTEDLEVDFASSMQPKMGQQDILAQAMAELAQDNNALSQILTYSIDGIDKHKKTFSNWLTNKGIKNSDDLIFLQGAQQGVYSCLQILTEPGDLVLHETLCYPGFYRAAEASRLAMKGLTLTSEGLDLGELEAICKKYSPKVLYITPNNQNPTNVKYSQEQLDNILALSRRYQFFIIEDDVNYCLPNNWRLPLQQKAPDWVFYISSLSKYFAGGLRVGYVLVPVLFQQVLKQNIHSQCWMVSTMNFELASRFIQSDSYQYNQEKLAQELIYRQQAFKMLFDKYKLTARLGGLNIWLELPSHINMHQLSGLLLANNVKIRTADLFSAQSGSENNAIRISLGGPDRRGVFNKGIEIMDKVFKQLHNNNDVVI